MHFHLLHLTKSNPNQNIIDKNCTTCLLTLKKETGHGPEEAHGIQGCSSGTREQDPTSYGPQDPELLDQNELAFELVNVLVEHNDFTSGNASKVISASLWKSASDTKS